ncbi:hypothetical protein C8241_02705 [Paracidovorax avenae]|uniref:AAA family ATPase n=1 Tax=Paracidovorax avenae TaxID=80867 RepID=UPI000D1745B4|nr:AAA family ATPase [Paracidovorax avenae]AVS60767.1 hypothetical protein C8241_02705 [Paracidovorax avenae]
MRLKSVTLNYFRCFESLTLDLDPRLTVIVGENGAGKTAVLDGIASGLTPVLTQLSSADQRLGGRGIKDSDFCLQALPGTRGKTQWNTADYAQIMTTTFEGLRWDYWRPSGSGKGKKPAETWGETALKEHLNAITDSYKTANPALTPVFTYYGASRGHIEVPERLRSAKNNYEHPTAALVDCFNPRSDFREMLAWFDQEESSELRANKGLTGENYQPFSSLEAVRATVVSLLGGAFRNPQFNARHKFVLERASDGAELLVSQLSQGYQSMLALAIDFARRLAIANRHAEYGNIQAVQQLSQHATSVLELHDPGIYAPFQHALAMSAPAIMLVDEIDLHLHPIWQQRVLDDLMRTFPMTQFIVTTHSPQVLTSVRRENIRILEQHEGRMRVRTPEFSPLAHESGDALAKIMGTHREPPLPLQDDIRQYEQLVREGQENTEFARTLRNNLHQAGYQFHESDLATWRFLAQRSAGKAH